MEEIIQNPKSKRQKMGDKQLNQDLLDQCPGSGQKSRRNAQLNPHAKKLDDLYKQIGDIWTPVKGYDLFIYHYRKMHKHKPVSNPWRLNLGKLTMPIVFVNVQLPIVFVNVQLLKLFEKKYNPKTCLIELDDESGFFPIKRYYIATVYQLDSSLDNKFRIRDLLTEYRNMSNDYKRWKLPLHRPRDENNKLRVFSRVEDPPYSIELFEDYFKSTYYSVCQILGVEASMFMEIVPMVLTTDI